MKKYRWIREDYNSVLGKHVKTSEGGFLAKSLRGAKRKACLKARVSEKAVWIREGEGGYKRQVLSPSHTNINPILYLFVDRGSAVIAKHDMPEVGIRKGDEIHTEGGKITGIVPKEVRDDA